MSHDKTGDEIEYSRNAGADERIGELCAEMLNVVAAAEGGGHDGGVGNHGAMVAHNSAGQHSRYQNIQGDHTGGSHGDNDGDYNGKGTPRGSGCKGHQSAGDKYQCGNDGVGDVCRRDAGNESADIQLAADAAQAEGKDQQHSHGDHFQDTLPAGLDGLAVLHAGEDHAHDNGHHVADEHRVKHRGGCVTIGENALSGDELTTDDAGNDHQNGENNEPGSRGLCVMRLLRFIVRNDDGVLGLLHTTDVPVLENDDQTDHQRDDAVEVKGKRFDHDAHGVRNAQRSQQADNIGTPGVQRQQRAHGGGGRVHQIGDLFARVAIVVGQRLTDGGGNGLRGVLVKEQNHTDEPGQKLRLGGRGDFGFLLQPLNQAVYGAGNLHKLDHAADQRGEQDELHVPCAGYNGDQLVKRHPETGQRVASGQNDAAAENTDEHTDKNLLCREANDNR